jgi:hypothetical protein
MGGSEADMEQRKEPRHKVNGPAHLVTLDGRILGVDLRDLSANGALTTHPEVDGIDVGEALVLAGARMPWERQAVVVGVSPVGLHLEFRAA